jgi:hypothetical protein
MTSAEFALHRAYWLHEPTGPAGEMQRWAMQQAALLNGPMVKRNSKQPFKAEEFWSAEKAWEPPPPPSPPGTKKKRLAPDFSHLRGMKVRNNKR